MTPTTALLAALLLGLALAHDDYQALKQPQVLRSPCAERWEQLAASPFGYYDGASGSGDASASDLDADQEDRRHHHVRARPLALEQAGDPSELFVDLAVQFSRFESSYVRFNTRTYNGQIPAPTIKVCPGDRLVLTLANELQEGWANMTNVHLHGMHVSPSGNEDNVMRNVQPGESLQYEYHIRPDHPAGTYWYHPHSHGLVNTQLQGMMAGVLVVVDRPGDFPAPLAAMDDQVLILQAVCVEKCHNAYDVLPDALRSQYGSSEMNMGSMGMSGMDMGKRKRSRMLQKGNGMDGMGMEGMDMEDDEEEEEDDDYSDEDEDDEVDEDDEDDEEEEGDEEEDEEEEAEFPVDLWVDARAPPLNATSLPTVFVNGQYLPELHFVPGELKRMRFLNAIPNNVAELVLPECEMFVLAMDGVYRDAPKVKSVVVIPPGGRADLAVRCSTPGVYFIQTETSPSRDHLLGGATHHRVPSQRVVSLRVLDPEEYAESSSASGEAEEDEELEEEDKTHMELPTVLPKRPEYMADTRGVASSDIPSSNRYRYEFSVWTESGSPASVYGVNRKPFAMDFVNHTMRVDEMQEWALAVRNYDSKGHACDSDAAPTSDVTFANAPKHGVLKEGEDSGCPHSMNHPFHMHSTHVQVVDLEDPSIDPDGVLFDVGDWRDTLPLFKSGVTVRFAARGHMKGKVFTHCHISSHADGGMAQLVQVVE